MFVIQCCNDLNLSNHTAIASLSYKNKRYLVGSALYLELRYYQIESIFFLKKVRLTKI